MALFITVIPPDRDPHIEPPAMDQNQGHLAPPTPRSIPLTPRTRAKTFARYTEAMKEKSANTTSTFKKIQLFIARQMLNHCEPCIVSESCGTKSVSLKKLPDRITTVKHCSNCLAAIPCALACLGTLGYTLHNEEYLFPCLKSNKVAPAAQVMQ